MIEDMTTQPLTLWLPLLHGNAAPETPTPVPATHRLTQHVTAREDVSLSVAGAGDGKLWADSAAVHGHDDSTGTAGPGAL